jgi:predicted nuclease with TOPRIM domain
MLYLAEIQKQKGGFIGSGKAELRLLACQRTEQNWSAIQGEELVAAPDEANSYGAGVLVLVDMNANWQIQAPLREAGRHLVGILQNLSRQIEKYKKEADEIESWRQSLGLQSQQLQLRQEEIYNREEELEATRGELERLTQESQHLDETLKSSEKQRQELAAAWEKLREEQQLLEQQSRGEGLTPQQLSEMRFLISQLHNGTTAPATLHAVEFQQDLLHQHWDKLQQQQQKAEAEKSLLVEQQQLIVQRKQELQQLQAALEQSQTEWEVQQHALSIRQEYAQQLVNRIQLEDENYQKILMLARGGVNIITSDKVDIEQIESLPIEELETIVNSLQKEVDQATNLVNLQEEELNEQQALIEKMQAEMANATDFDKLQLENELNDEQDGYQMLEQTLEGQRETLSERLAVLNVHISILQHRQSQAAAGENSWDNALQLLADQRHRQQEELERTKVEIQHLHTALEQAKDKVERQVNEYLAKSEEVQKLEQSLQELQQRATELQARSTLYEEMIQPLQSHINSLKDNLGEAVPNGSIIAKLESMLDDIAYNSQATLAS